MSITSKDVNFMSGSRTLGGYMARPAEPGTHPGVVVIHEAYGLTDNIKDVTRRFADQGYSALAVDLFRGRNQTLCMAQLFAGLLFNSQNHAGIHDLKAALSYLVEQPDVDGTRVGAIGFCLGGGLALAWACTDDRLKAIAPFYGINPRPLEAMARACPIVGSYPEKDFTAGAGRKLDAFLDTTAVPHDIKIYPNAHHSFFNDQGRAHDAEAEKDSWARVLSFFQSHLGA